MRGSVRFEEFRALGIGDGEMDAVFARLLVGRAKDMLAALPAAERRLLTLDDLERPRLGIAALVARPGARRVLAAAVDADGGLLLLLRCHYHGWWVTSTPGCPGGKHKSKTRLPPGRFNCAAVDESTFVWS